MEPFKNKLNPEVVRMAAHHLQRVWPAFDRKRFEPLAIEGLDALEFKARAEHLCSALEATLPEDFDQAASIIEASLAPTFAPRDDLSLMESHEGGLAGWIVWSLGEFVVRRGLAHPARALQTLHALTQRFSAEFAIRPFIEHHPDLTLKTLGEWAHDPSHHVRRLVSEGSRPRLPWGLQLKALVADPSPTLPLLRALQDDPSEYVRRSVANHLNDIAKDHPGLVVDWLAQHLPHAPAERKKLLRHASRTLIKQGHHATLSQWGLGSPYLGTLSWQVTPHQVSIGGALQLQLVLTPTGAAPQVLEIDYRVHHLKANGEHSPKTFKGCRLTLQPGQPSTWTKSHALRLITTRRYYPGPHLIDVQINGTVVAQAAFELTN